MDQSDTLISKSRFLGKNVLLFKEQQVEEELLKIHTDPQLNPK